MNALSLDRSLWLANHIVPHEPELRGWLARLSGVGGDQIDDLVQETYAVLAARADVSGIENPRAYAFQVARSILLQQVRRARVVPLETMADLETLEHAADSPSPEQHVIARDEYARVAAAIAAMPPQTRRVFQLRRVEGLSQRDIAAQVGLSENTVEKHVMRGIKILMRQFGRGGRVPAHASSAHQEGSPLPYALPRIRENH